MLFLILGFTTSFAVKASQLSHCREALLESDLGRLALKNSLDGMILDDQLFVEPENDSEVDRLLEELESEVRTQLFRSDAIKAGALKRIADQIKELRHNLEIPRLASRWRAMAYEVIDLWQVQKLLKGKLPQGFRMDSLPYLFLRKLHANSIASGAGLKIRIVGDAHNRLFVKIQVTVDDNQRLRVQVTGIESQNRHGAYTLQDPR